MATKLNLNTYPYYDDFDLDKNFHRVLFKPGFAVQARELTQLQTILQDQIKRFGDNIFKEGSVISGCPESTNFGVDVIKILDTDTAGQEITDAALLALEGKILVGANDNVKAVVKKVATGSETTTFKAVFLQYISQGDSGTTETFVADEVLTQDDDENVTVIIADASQTPVTKGSLFSVGDGVVYANGYFIRHYTQTIVLEKYSDTPSKKVGFLVSEEVITSDDDETLLDPAQGAFNYTAPGADRFKLSTTLVAYPINETVEGFFVLYEVSAGAISRRYDRTQYAELNKTLARRTYDESGDYVVRPFNYHIREHLVDDDTDGVYTSVQGGDNGKLALGVEPGKAYVRGFEYELFATKYLDVVKPTDTNERTAIRLSTAYGNYLIVDEMCGNIPSNGSLVSLRGAAAGAVTAGTYSSTSAPGSQIGTARIATVEYISGTSGAASARYRVYLYDIEMTGGSVSDIQGIYFDNASKDFHADVADTPAVLKESSFSPYIIPTTYDYVKTLQPNTLDNSFVYRKHFTSVAVAANGSASVSVSGDENFAFTTSTNATILTEFIVIAETTISTGSTIYTAGQVINMVGANATVTPGTNTINFNIYTPGSLTGSPTVSVLASVSRSDVTPRTKTLNTDRYVRIQTTKKLGYVSSGTYLTATASTGSANIAFSYNASVAITSEDCPAGSKIYTSANVLLGTVSSVTARNDGTSTGPIVVLTGNSAANITTTSSTPLRVVHPNWDVVAKRFTTSASLGLYDIYAVDYVKAGDVETSWATINTSGDDYTGQFKIKNGQTDSHYNLGTIDGGFLEERRYVVRVDHFVHNAGAFFNVNSYPLPAQGSSPTSTQIDWHKMPVYMASNGKKYEMRDCVDFRVTVANVATSTTTLTSSNINPIGYTASTKAYTGFTPFYIPHPQEEFITDIEWNLPRVDRVVLDADGNFTVVQGLASENPLTPKLPSNCMDLGVLQLPPFPALSPKAAKLAGRPVNASSFSKADLQRRYTMADIGVIEKRLGSLEEFTKLSFLEQKTINALIYNDTGEERFKNGVLVDSFDRAEKINLNNETNDCLIYQGVLSPRLDADPIDLEVSSTSSVLLAPTDAKIVVRQTVGATNFGIGETVSQATSGATGEVEHRVEIARGGNYKWVRLYLVNCTGTFVANTAYTVTGTTTSTTGLITYTGITTAILAADFRPDLVNYPADGEIATLPYEHVVFTENPYASESVSVTNNVVYGYEGSIGLIPAEDIWYEHRTQPQIINHYNTEVIIKEVEKQVEVIREVEKIVEVSIPMPVIVEQVAPPPPPPPPVKKEKPVVPVFVEQNWNLKPIKIDSVGGALGVPAIISVTPTIIDEGFPVFLPLDSPAPPEETPPVYGGGGGGATGRDPASIYGGGGMTWKGGEIEPISSFGFQDVNAI
jgi:hypothetical protein